MSTVRRAAWGEKRYRTCRPQPGTMVLAVPGRAQARAQTAAVVPEPREAEEASTMEAERTEVSAKVEGRPLS